MKRKTLILWLCFGLVLALGPLWGLLGTVAGMIRTFHQFGQEAAQADAVAEDIHMALYTTAAGWIAFPFGIAIIMVSALKLGKAPDGGGAGVSL